jgi:hypothetical protein
MKEESPAKWMWEIMKEAAEEEKIALLGYFRR